MSAISKNSGFTLLEVLIAVVLLGILTAALYGSYFGVIRARDRASAGMETRRELGETLDLIRREIASAQLNSVDKKLGLGLCFVVEDRDYFGARASVLKLTTLASPLIREKNSGIIIVTYRVEEKGKKLMLKRQVRDLFIESSAVTYTQMEEISSFLVECSSDGSKWVKVWDDSMYVNKPPKYVRVTIEVKDQGGPVQFTVLSEPRVI